MEQEIARFCGQLIIYGVGLYWGYALLIGLSNILATLIQIRNELRILNKNKGQE